MNSYYQLHEWVKKELGRPNKCEHCGTEDGLIEWANKSNQYLHTLSDWLRLCRSCHMKYDWMTAGINRRRQAYV